jgi:hypothetical protein
MVGPTVLSPRFAHVRMASAGDSLSYVYGAGAFAGTPYCMHGSTLPYITLV